jgi:hypothetical protein
MNSIKVIEKVPYDDILIVFSARKCEMGKFTFYNQVIDFPANIIFINDYSTNWYLSGTSEFKDVLGFIKTLTTYINKLKKNNSKIYTLGSSMGAYAALLYGSIIQADKILAFGPESELCIPLGRSIESLNNRYKEGEQSILDLEYKDSATITIISGNNDIVDFYCASKFKYFNNKIDVILINNYTHVVAKYIHEKIEMKQFLLNYFFYNDLKKSLDLMDLSFVSDLESAHAIKKFNELLIMKRKVDMTQKTYIYKIAFSHSKWSMIQYFAACIAYKESNLELSIKYLKIALNNQSNLGRARLKLANIYYEQKKFQLALEELAILQEQNFTYSIGILLVKIYIVVYKEEKINQLVEMIFNKLTLNEEQKTEIKLLIENI